MAKRHFENLTASAILLGGVLIPPGSGRDVDESLIPRDAQVDAGTPAGSAQPALADLVAQLQAQSVKDITAELPSLTQEALDMLREAESGAAKPRTSLIAALDAEHLRRADEQLQADADAAYQRQLAGLTPEQLAAVGEGGALTGGALTGGGQA